ncbi:c-type cytochrome [Nautilia sp.]
MRLFFTALFVLVYAKNEEWFITNLEYGKMLYNNPRGISCAKCHGIKGEGKIITSFINSKGEKTVIKTEKFHNLTFEWFKKILFKRIKLKKYLKKHPSSPLKYLNIMPKYNYLTDNEIKAILLYLKSKD